MQSRAEVIGAGLAGLAAATALAQRGWRVRLPERDGEIRAIGAGIYVWGNGLATLQILVLDWIMTAPGAEFLSSLDESQRHDAWQQARNGLFDVWLAGGSNPVVKNHLDNEMAAFDYDMWALSCRVIKESYQQWGSPMERMRAIEDPSSARHWYSQPVDPAYELAQAESGGHNPWFSHRRLHAETHFPTLDSAATVAEEIRAALAQTG